MYFILALFGAITWILSRVFYIDVIGTFIFALFAAFSIDLFGIFTLMTFEVFILILFTVFDDTTGNININAANNIDVNIPIKSVQMFQIKQYSHSK